MLRGVIISADADLSNQLHGFLTDLGSVGVVRRTEHYPASIEIGRFIRAHAPQVVFLGVDSTSRAAETAKVIEELYPSMALVGFSRDCTPQLLMEAMRAGIREFLLFPFSRQNIGDAVSRIRSQVEARPPAIEMSDMLFTFIPSKAGVGASTIATSTAVALSRLSDTPAFLGDLDLNSGMVRFMLKLENTYCITDAAEHSAEMDEELWPQLVTRVGNLDVLHAGRLNPGYRIEPNVMRQLLGFVRRNYRVSCVDLSGNLERYSLEAMLESKRIFLVCTPEIPSLHLAREKFLYLQEQDLGDRVSVLLNRCQKRPLITPAQIEQLLGLPVHMTFPNDYQCVHRALAAGKAIDFASDLGKQISTLASTMIERKLTSIAESKKRFIEFFSVTAGREKRPVV